LNEIALAKDDVDELRFRLDQALTNLGVANAAPAAVVQSIEDFVDRWQDANRTSEGAAAKYPDVEDVAFGLGVAWGEQFVREFDWQWISLRDGRARYFAVARADRDLVVYPIDFLRACLTSPDMDCTAMLAFNMLVGKKVPAMPPNRYEDLMRGVRRIVPKR
jgi:hypothetical protein